MDEYHNIIACLQKVYSGKNLKEVLNKYDLDRKRNKIKNHCYGIIRHYYQINYIVNKLSKKTEKLALIILQIGIYELKYSSKPDYAVINDLVKLIKIKKNKLAGFINAVLRNYIRNKDKFDIEIANQKNLKYDLPDWLINKIIEQYPNEKFQILSNLALPSGFGIRVNQKLIDSDKYIEQLNQKEIDYFVIDNKIILDKSYSIKEVPGFNEGLVSIQDVSAQYLIDLLNKYSILPLNVLDACSAPGGKLCQLLENYDNLNATALDNSEERLKRVTQNLERLGLNAKLIMADASNKNWWDGKKFDLVIADVPCSATGTIKRNPDIKINRLKSDIKTFIDQQRKIVKNLFDVIEDNGFMVYITCSILAEENQYNIKWFSDELNKFNLIQELQILPSEKSDSLYYALIQKK